MRPLLVRFGRGPAPRLTLTAALALALGGGVALAAASFEPAVGPTWLNPGYQWTVRVLTISNPDKTVCMEYKVTPPGTTTTTFACDCVDYPGSDCTQGTGDWTCTIPNDLPNATIDWSMATYSTGGGGLCGGLKTPIASGSMPTGPLAVHLSSFQARTLGSGGGAALVAGLAMAWSLLRKRRSAEAR